MNTLYTMFLVSLAAGGVFYAVWFGHKCARTADHVFGVGFIGILWGAALLGMAAASYKG